MANLTIVVDDQLLQAARIKALQQGTSVNEVCREAIERFAGRAERGRKTLAALQTLMKQPRSHRTEPIWSGREAFYDEVMRERGVIKPEADDASRK